MAEKAINFDHSTGTITTVDDTTVNVEDSLLIGDGTALKPEDLKEDGLLKVQVDKDGIPHLYTTKNGEWVIIGDPYDETLEMIWAIVMGS